MKKKSKKGNYYFKFITDNNDGQMLLFVLVVVLLLLLIVLAIITNVRVDIKETQMEREYETGYSIAEEELFKISANGYQVGAALSGDEDNFCPTTGCIGGSWECSKKTGVGGDLNNTVIVKRCEQHSINNMTIDQDQTLEVDLNDNGSYASGNLTLTWYTAPAMSIMLICKDGAGNYKNVRAAVCRTGRGNCGMSSTPNASGFISISDAQTGLNLEHPLNMSGCGTSFAPELLRIRAIGGQATNVSVTGGNLPPQMEEIRVQSFTEGTALATELSAPEVVTVSMIQKRVPALFDYVLFVANGEVRK
jgi:hypothetical protein